MGQEQAPDESERQVYEWRLEQFKRIGFAGYHATWLASHDEVELEAARKLIARGCSVDLAMQILV